MLTPLSPKRRRIVTGGLLLGMSLGALEATVVGTAMPTIVALLGGMDHYSWVFSAYLLTSTASVPIWGRLSDLYGRRLMYLVGVGLFLVGSALAGAAQSMVQLVVFRAIQGLGAGALVPLAMTIIGEIYTVKERPRVQALFSGMWGVASIAGPLLGGWLTDTISWRWVFYINIPFGILTAVVLGVAYPAHVGDKNVKVDWLGAGLMFGGVSGLLVALSVDVHPVPWLIVSVVLLVGFAVIERRVADPILPLSLFSVPIVRWSLPIVFLLGMGLFGAIAFVPLFVQGAMGGSATEAGQVLTPLFLGWVATSIAAARLTLTVGYRPLSWLGLAMMTGAFLGLSQLQTDSSHWYLLSTVFVLGCGMGFSTLSLLLAIQNGVPRTSLGLATSLNQFSRSVGAALGVALMGALLAWWVGPDAGAALVGEAGSLRVDPVAAERLASGLRVVFGVGAAVSALAALPTLALPQISFTTAVAVPADIYPEPDTERRDPAV